MTGLSVEMKAHRTVGSMHARQPTADTDKRFLTDERMNAQHWCVQDANDVATFTKTCRSATFSKGQMENTVIWRCSVSKLYSQGMETQLAFLCRVIWERVAQRGPAWQRWHFDSGQKGKETGMRLFLTPKKSEYGSHKCLGSPLSPLPPSTHMPRTTYSRLEITTNQNSIGRVKYTY